MSLTSKSQLYCSLCAEDRENGLATIWCPSCHDPLCSNCSKHHRRSKYTKHHAVVSVEDYEKFPNILKSQPSSCREHECSFDFYCRKHEIPCCVNCLSENHSPCCSSREIVSLANIIGNFNSSERLETIDTFFKCII